MSELSNLAVGEYGWESEKEEQPDDSYDLCFCGSLSNGKTYFLVVLHNNSGEFYTNKLLSDFDNIEQSFNLWFREANGDRTQKSFLKNLLEQEEIEAPIEFDTDYYVNYLGRDQVLKLLLRAGAVMK